MGGEGSDAVTEGRSPGPLHSTRRASCLGRGQTRTESWQYVKGRAGICHSRQGGAHHVDLSPTLASENYFVSSFDETEGRKLRCEAYTRPGTGRPWAPPLTQFKPRRFQACKPWTMASPIARSVGGVGTRALLRPLSRRTTVGVRRRSHDAQLHALASCAAKQGLGVSSLNSGSG